MKYHDKSRELLNTEVCDRMQKSIDLRKKQITAKTQECLETILVNNRTCVQLLGKFLEYCQTTSQFVKGLEYVIEQLTTARGRLEAEFSIVETATYVNVTMVEKKVKHLEELDDKLECDWCRLSDTLDDDTAEFVVKTKDTLNLIGFANDRNRVNPYMLMVKTKTNQATVKYQAIKLEIFESKERLKKILEEAESREIQNTAVTKTANTVETLYQDCQKCLDRLKEEISNCKFVDKTDCVNIAQTMARIEIFNT